MRNLLLALAVIIPSTASAYAPTLTGPAAKRFIKGFERIVVLMPREQPKDFMYLSQWEKLYPSSQCDTRTEPNPAQSDSTRVLIECPEFADTSQLSFVFVTDPTKEKQVLYLKEILNNGKALNRDEFENFAERPLRSDYGNFQTVLSRQDVLLVTALDKETFTKVGDLQMFQGRMVHDLGYYCDVAYQKVHNPELTLRCAEDTDEASKNPGQTKPTFFANIIMDSNQLWVITDVRIGNRRIAGRDLVQFFKPLRPRQQSER